MYYIRKYSDCWAIHDDDTGASRQLTTEETKIVSKEFPTILDDNVRTIYTGTINSISMAEPKK